MTENKIKILMVEDEKDLAEVYSLQMKMSGIDVVVATDGATAMDAITKQKFDLVLMDLVMPDMNGFDALEKIRANPKLKNLPIYAWSNLSQKKEIEMAKKCGATDFWIKSGYTPKSLAEKIKGLINKK